MKMTHDAPQPPAASTLDVAVTLDTEPHTIMKQPVQETTMVATGRPRPALRAAHSLDFDEAQLLAETEDILGNLDPLAFLGVPTTQKEVNIIPICSSASSSSSEDSSASKKLETSGKSSRKRGSKPGAMHNPSRERMQNELAHLRKHVLVLEKELQNVQARHGIIQHPSDTTQLVVVPPMWERVAKRQLAACERVVSENKRLKRMLKLQKELVAGLEESLYNLQHVAALPATLSLSLSAPNKNVHLEPGDALLFEMMVSELDAIYLGLDSAFQEAAIDKPVLTPFTCATLKTNTTHDGRLRSFFEMVDVDVSPFDFELMGRVAEICGEQQSQSPDCVTYDRDWGSEDIITEKHRVKRVFNGVEIYFHMLTALKFHPFDDHVISVSRSIFKCEDRFPDAYVQETGWFTCASLASQSSGDVASASVGCVTKSCVHLEPKRFHAPTAAIKAEADTMTTFVMNSYENDMQEIDDMMEKLLIEESSKTKV